MKIVRLGFVIALAVVALNANAQVVAGVMPVQGGSISGLSKIITVQLSDASLVDAIRTVARNADIEVTLATPVISQKKRVTLKSSSITAQQAFVEILKGTNVSMSARPNGSVVFSITSEKKLGQGVITGRITDAKSGKGVSGASISVDSDGYSTLTDENGLYKLSGISSGIHVIVVRLVGYSKQTRIISVGEGATVTVDFKIEHTANVLDQVIITGTMVQTELKAVPNAITVITAKQIEERGITRIDQLFRGDIPGLFSMNSGSSTQLDEVTMFSRGATGLSDSVGSIGGTFGSAGVSNRTNPIKTYIDGIEMADPKYLSQIDPSSIERIEILTGPQASTIYGSNAINGVMQIFTKRGMGNKPQLTLGLTSGVAQNNFSSHLAPSHLINISTTGIEGRFSYSLGSSWNYVGSWTPSNQTQRLSYNGGGKMDLGKTAIDVSARQGLTRNKQNGIVNGGNIGLINAGINSPNSFSGLPTPQLQTLSDRTLGLVLSYRPFAWWSHELSLGSDAFVTGMMKTAYGFSSESDTSFQLGINSTISRTSENYRTTLQLPLSSFAGLNLTIGGDHWITKGLAWDARPLSLTGPSLRSPCPTTTSCIRSQPARNSGAFVQGQFSLFDMLFVTYGVRTDWNRAFGDNAKVSPGRYGVSVTRELGPIAAKLRGSYGRSIRPPVGGIEMAVPVTSAGLIGLFGQFDGRLANPDLGPEYQQGGEGGIELYFGSRASLVVTRYNQTVDNLISLVGTSISGVDSVRSLIPNNLGCSSNFRDADGYCYRWQTQYLNVGSIRNQGWELQSSLNIGPLTTRGTYSWTKSRVLGITPRYRAILQSVDVSFQPGRSFDYVPEHTWALGMTYAQHSNTISLAVNGVGMLYTGSTGVLSVLDRLVEKRPLMNTPSGYRGINSGYVMADLNAAHRLSSRLDVLLQISNLTNYYQNDRNLSFAVKGRETKAGARFRLQ